jgi:ATP-binding cassette subfamily B protein
VEFLGILATAIVLWFGGRAVIAQELTLGVVVAFLAYVTRFFQPIQELSQLYTTMQAAMAGGERVLELLDTAPDVCDAPDALEMQTISGRVELDHLCFAYRDGKDVLNDVNLVVEPGQTLALVGPTGAGKTTLVNLLLRFYELNGGRITIDGTDITKMSRGDLRSLFGMVLQDTWLYKGTIMENIGYGLEDPDTDKIIEAAKAAHADHFVRSLPMGYDTILNEEASNISQGQKQLLTIARALLADPPILILDEATSSVDTRTEALIQKAMAQLMQGRTSFVIAHRLSTIKNADLILVMKNGTVIEQGTHEELISQKGFYEDLYNSQFAANPESQEEENE